MPARTVSIRARILLLTALALSVLLAIPVTSHAAVPAGMSTMSTAELATLLAAAPPEGIPGYFATVLKGSDVTTLPCDVLAVTGDSLVLFEATGPVIDKIGGVAAGMSGSPVFVPVGGEDVLVGAVAYGDVDTRGGMGLATPIDAMSEIDDAYTGATVPLGTTVMTADGPKDSVRIVTDAAAPRTVSPKTITMQPLGTIFIGGVNTSSRLYDQLSKRMTGRGYSVVPMGTGSGTGHEDFSADFLPGSSVAVLAARGDLTYGALGTVTYSNGTRVMAFGHPFANEGDTGLYLNNAWVDGIWPSNYSPYKLGSPSALRGTVTQDRLDGVLGVVGTPPAETLISSNARVVESGKRTSSRVYLPEHVMSSSTDMWWGLAPYAAAVAPYEAYNTLYTPGSAMTTTTVVVSDGAKRYLIVRRNVWDEWDWLPEVVSYDVDDIVGQLQDYLGADTGVRIERVHLESAMSTARRSATVLDVKTPRGLQWGANRVLVTLRRSGSTRSQTFATTLTIPRGTSLTGELEAYGNYDYGWDEDEDTYSDRSLGKAVADMRAQATNDMVVIDYTPYNRYEPVATKNVRIGRAVYGDAYKETTTVELESDIETIHAGTRVELEGYVDDAEDGTIEVWARSAGSTTERRIATTSLVTRYGETGFYVITPALEKTSYLRVVYSGNEDLLGSQARVIVPVRARVALAASDTTPDSGDAVRLTATVRPLTYAGYVSFQRYVGGRWQTMATRRAVAGKAVYSFSPSAGTVKVRAITRLSSTNVSGVSSKVTLDVD